MSILIKGMEMPKSCDDCQLKEATFYAVRADICFYNKRNIDPYAWTGKRPDWCPLIEAEEAENDT